KFLLIHFVITSTSQPYCYLIKLETFIHQLVDQHKIVQNCAHKENQFERSKMEKLNLLSTNKTLMKTMNTFDNNATMSIPENCDQHQNPTCHCFNETNPDLLHVDYEMRIVNCRFDAWQLNLQIVSLQQELYASKLGN
ncbi:unnamed protein product, partial [Schistosoma turkestanicum]